MPIWFYWAAASAVFAALTAIFAKVGLQGINSDFATFIRTIFDFIGLGNRGIMGGVFQSLAIGQRFTSRTN